MPVWSPLLLSAALASGAGAAARTPAIAFDYGGKAITVRYLTGVRYRKGRATCDFAFRKWARNGAATSDGFFPIHFGPHSKVFRSGRAMYRALLQGAMDQWLRGRAIAWLIKAWHLRLSKYVALANIPKYAAVAAQLATVETRLDDGQLVHGWDLAKSRRMSKRLLGPSAGQAREAFELARRNAAQTYCSDHVVPVGLGGGRIAPWYREMLYAGLEPVAVGAAALARPRFCHRIVAEAYGSWHLEAAGPLPPERGGLAAMKAFVLATSEPDGTLHASAMLQGDAALQLLGSPTVFEANRLPLDLIGADFGIPVKAICPGALLRAGRKSRLSPVWVYVYQLKNKWGDKLSASPGGLPYSALEGYLIPLALRHVLSKCRPGLGMRLPSVGRLFGTIYGGGFWTGTSSPSSFAALSNPTYVLPGVAWPRMLISTPWPLIPPAVQARPAAKKGAKAPASPATGPSG